MLNNNISGSRRPRALVVVVLVDLVLGGHVLGLLSHTVEEVTGLALQGEESAYTSTDKMAYPTVQLRSQHWIRENKVVNFQLL